MSAVRSRARVEGVVQGVGFRPFVHRLAGELELAGFVLNDERGVLVEVQGEPERVAAFLARLRADAPPLAVVERVLAETVAPVRRGRLRDRRVRARRPARRARLRRRGDLRRLPAPSCFDPADRRYRYPFLNCTNCGPRFTIVRGVPYDRPNTTMAGFRMCAACLAEYDDPADRRFHAQPIACPDCGPDADPPPPSTGSDPVDGVGRGAAFAAAGWWRSRGSAGSTSRAVAADERAVAALRARKHREDKPFALMVARRRRGGGAGRAGRRGGAAAALARAADRARRRGGRARPWRRRWRRAPASSG